MKAHVQPFALILCCLLAQAVTAPLQAKLSTFNHWTVENGLSNNHTKAFLRDSRGYLWIGTEAGLNRFDGYQFKHYFHVGKFYTDDIHTLNEDGNGNLWINSDIIYEWSNNRFSSWRDYMTQTGVETAYDEARHIDANGNLWAFHPEHILHYDFRTRQTQKWQTSIGAMSWIADNGTWLYAITTTGRIFLFDKEKQLKEHIVRHPDIGSTLLSNGVCHLYSDPNDLMWLGYYNTGMSAYRSTHNHSHNFYSPKYRKISSFVQDKQGALWIGTDGYGLWKQQAGREQQAELPGNVCTSLVCDYEGRIWASTFTHGLLCYENGKPVRRLHRGNSGISNNYISGMVQDRYGVLWLLFPWGTLQGYHPDTGEFENFYLQHADRKEAIRGMSLYYDGGDHLYACTFWGIYRLNVSTHEGERILGNRRGTQEFSGKTVQSVCHDAYGMLWVGTTQGISVWDVQADSIHYLTRREGLCDNAVKGIYKDSGGKMWVLTGNGLSVIDIRKEQDVRFSISNYYSSDGLISCKFERYAFMEQDSGNVMLGTELGYSTVRRDKLTDMGKASNKLVLTGLHIGNTEIQPRQSYDGRLILPQPIEEMSSLELSHRDEYITLEFSSMNLLDARKMRYAYRVEEFSTNWMHTTDNKIFFSNLQPGTYHLHIKAFRADGMEEAGSLRFRIRMAPLGGAPPPPTPPMPSWHSSPWQPRPAG